MDQTITKSKIDSFVTDFDGIMRDAVSCSRKTAKQKNRIDCNAKVFSDIIKFMPKFIKYRDNVVTNKNFENDLAGAYLSLLPQFDVIVHTYIAVATGAIEAQDWNILNGCSADDKFCTIEGLKCDRDSTLDDARIYIDSLLKWVQDAQNAIVESALPKTHINDNDHCTYKPGSTSSSWYFPWNYDCGDIKATRE